MTEEKFDLTKIKENTVDMIVEQVKSLTQKNELHLPSNYSAANALKSAWLLLQDIKDKNKNPVLQVCTSNSISFSLLDMIIQGLNPAKKQCYFIAHGKTLVLRRSYHGSRALTINACGAKDVDAQVVWGNDELEYIINKGKKEITLHKQKLENIGKNPKAAYCRIDLPDGSQYTDIMTMEQIKTSWKKSPMNPNQENSVHQQFAEEMIKRTVTNRACKKYINQNCDDLLLLQSINRQYETDNEAKFEEEVQEQANKQLIDIEGDSVDTKTGEIMEETQKEEPEPVGAVPDNGGPGF